MNLFGQRDDFDNSGSSDHAYTDFLYATLGALFQAGPFGVGVNGEIQRYAVHPTDGKSPESDVIVGKYHGLVAFRMLGDQLMLGAGVRVASLSLAPHGTKETSLTMIGAAPELGVLVRPDWQPFRIGATFRMPVHGGQLLGETTTRADGVKTAAGLVLPGDVVLPWEVELGAALQVGPRPLNPRYIEPHDQEAALHRSFAKTRRARLAAQAKELERIRDPAAWSARKAAVEKVEAAIEKEEDAEEKRVAGRLEDERRARAENWPREHLLLTLELLVTGSVADGVSLARFLAQNQGTGDASVVGTSGAGVSYSPRFGVETEPVPGWLQTRVGGYYEPSRLGDRVGRQHFTFGADVRLFTTTLWGRITATTYKAQAYADLSPRYQSVSVGLGVWH